MLREKATYLFHHKSNLLNACIILLSATILPAHLSTNYCILFPSYCDSATGAKTLIVLFNYIVNEYNMDILVANRLGSSKYVHLFWHIKLVW
mmetsp:Transcript_30894/g.40996  ORF Transcript_30894/g.40996 Transcript_30894/m.40996 type:complete len:92 (+) Transcript_30894:126-401(+)